MGEYARKINEKLGEARFWLDLHFCTKRSSKNQLCQKNGILISKQKLPTSTVKFKFEDGSVKRLAISEELLQAIEVGEKGQITYVGKRFKQFKK